MITIKPTEYYGHQNFTKHSLIVFLNFFSKRLIIERYDSTGAVRGWIKVPLQFGTRQKFITWLHTKNKHDSSAQQNSPTPILELGRIFPRVAIRVNNISYNPQHKLNKFHNLNGTLNLTTLTLETIMTPVPYSLSLTFDVIAKTYDDIFQIIEQIMPYFTPTLTLRYDHFIGFENEEIHVELNSVNIESDEDIDVDSDRLLTASLDFTLKTNYYYIKKTDPTIIKNIQTNFNMGNEQEFKTFTTMTQSLNEAVLPVIDIVTTITEP